MEPGPWNERAVSARDLLIFRNLADLHALTQRWRAEIGDQTQRTVELSVHELKILNDPEARARDPKIFRLLLDETQATDVLARLAQKIRAQNRRVFHEAGVRTASPAFAEATLQEGRAIADLRWQGLPMRERRDPRALVIALTDSPFAKVLVRRATTAEAQLEIRFCPHFEDSDAKDPYRDAHCAQLSYWMQGFAQGLNPDLGVQNLRKDGVCVQIWQGRA